MGSYVLLAVLICLSASLNAVIGNQSIGTNRIRTDRMGTNDMETDMLGADRAGTDKRPDSNRDKARNYRQHLPEFSNNNRQGADKSNFDISKLFYADDSSDNKRANMGLRMMCQLHPRNCLGRMDRRLASKRDELNRFNDQMWLSKTVASKARSRQHSSRSLGSSEAHKTRSLHPFYDPKLGLHKLQPNESGDTDHKAESIGNHFGHSELEGASSSLADKEGGPPIIIGKSWGYNPQDKRTEWMDRFQGL